MVYYKSTRGSQELKTSAQGIIQGIAGDEGLYVPTEIPGLPFDISEMKGKGYKEIAYKIIKAFFEDYTEEELLACVEGAYDTNFEASDIVPVCKAGGAYFLELYHGRTAAFKDMALSILPYLLTTAMKKENEKRKIVILTATSGDTGKAALAGFADVEGTEIIVFYPKKGVSQVQERQMITQVGKNVHVFGIEGNFDDAQTGVKEIFRDNSFAMEIEKFDCKLSSANSINIGRLVPQVAYYVYGYIKLVEDGVISEGEPINVAVPTGNFGNILAAYYSGQMGIPINKYICASNENKVLTEFLNSGVYDINRPFILTDSPSMDILISSNLERLLYHLSDEEGGEIKELMAELKTKGKYQVGEKIRKKLGNFYGGFANMSQTETTIREMYDKNHYLMDTHTAVAYKVYEQYVAETGDKTPTIIASTASPYKFAQSVGKAVGLGVEADGFVAIQKLEEKTSTTVPLGLKGLQNKEILHNSVIKKTEMPQVVAQAIKRD